MKNNESFKIAVASSIFMFVAFFVNYLPWLLREPRDLLVNFYPIIVMILVNIIFLIILYILIPKLSKKLGFA